MTKEELMKYGNELTISGFVVGNDLMTRTFMLPNERRIENGHIVYEGNTEQYENLLNAVIRQLDVQEIEGLQKVILRKSQRQIDQRVAWQVFRRDNFKCVYCGADDVPLTVDHIVLWEHMGDTVPDNLNCSCKKCNKTRGSMDYDEWIRDDYLKEKVHSAVMAYKFDGHNDTSYMYELKRRGLKAKELPLRKTKRSR